METRKRILGGLAMCLFELLVGILLLINPIGFTSGIIMAAGIALLIAGLVSIVKYLKMDAAKAAVSQSLMTGLIALLAGAFCTFKSQWFILTFPVLTMLYGVVVLVAGLAKVQKAVDMLRLKNKRWFLGAISALISILCGIVILQNPFASTTVLWMFTGISLIVEALFDVITLIVSGNEKAAAHKS